MTQIYGGFTKVLNTLDLRMRYRLVIGLFLLGATSAMAQWSVGLTGMAHQVGFSGDAPPPAVWSTKLGWGAGLSLGYDFGNNVTLTLAPQIEQRTSGLQATLPIENTIPPRDTTYDSALVRTSYFSIPIGMRVYSNSRRWFFSTGATMSFLQELEVETDSGTNTLENAIKPEDVLLYVGAGYHFDFDPISLNLEVRYTQGLLDLVTDQQTQFISNSPVIRMDGLQAMVSAEWRFGSTTAAASDSSRTTPLGPRMGGHLYTPLAGGPLPFIRTNASMVVGGGTTTTLELPIITIGDRLVIAPQGSLAYMAMTVRHEQAIKSWMSFFLEGRVIGRLGTSVSSLLAQGVNTVTSADLGWNVKIVEQGPWSVVGGLTMRMGNYTTVDVDRWAQGLIDSGYVAPGNELVDTRPSLKLILNARGAYSISPVVGLTAFINGGYTEPRVTADSTYDALFDVGLAVSINLDPWLEVPIGLAVGGDYRQIPEAGSIDQGETKSAHFRIAYTGSDAFSIGAQTVLQWAPIQGITDEVTFISALIDFRFYF
jgi:hypothetical protein